MHLVSKLDAGISISTAQRDIKEEEALSSRRTGLMFLLAGNGLLDFVVDGDNFQLYVLATRPACCSPRRCVL